MNNPLRAIYFLRSRYFKRMFLSLLFRARRSSCAKLLIYVVNICNFISRVLLRHNIFLFFLSLHLTKLEHGLLLFLKVPHALEGEKGLTYRKFAFKNLSGDLFPDDRAQRMQLVRFGLNLLSRILTRIKSSHLQCYPRHLYHAQVPWLSAYKKVTDLNRCIRGNLIAPILALYSRCPELVPEQPS